MAPEELNENENENPPSPETEDAPVEEPPTEGEPAPVSEPPAEEPAPTEDEPPSEAPGEPEVPTAAAPATEAEPEEALTPKQRRKAERSRASGPPGPQLSPEERAERRTERRRTAAVARRRYRAGRRQRGGERGTGTPPREPTPGARKARLGTVVSSAADKTITVRIEAARRHATYEKVVRRTSTLHAHDEANEAQVGDVVRVVETRPLSRTKRWRLVEVVERAR